MTEEERAVEVSEGDELTIRIGITVSDGPETYRLMLTRPVDKEGRIEEIPRESIEAVHEIKSGTRGEPPEIVED